MQVIQGDLWAELGVADLLLVSTNATLNKNGEVVMGRGAAKEAKERFPQLPFDLGMRLRTGGLAGQKYGVLISDITAHGTRLGAFQVKYHWQDDADLGLISHSAHALRAIAGDYERIAINFPGIGNGRLERSQVEYFLDKYWSDLDNLFVY
jgi:hypothetical protein